MKKTNKHILAMLINQNFISDIKSLLAAARQKAYSTINSIMVETYWNIGKKIVEEEQSGNEKAEYGTFLIRELSLELSGEFGKGFSEANPKFPSVLSNISH